MIPKKILQTSRNKPAPYIMEQLSRYFDSSWSYHHFTDDEIVSYFAENPVLELPNIIEKFYSMPTGAHKADLFRYYYLYINGGIFIDSDAMIKGNIEQICHDFDFFVVRSGWVAGTLFQGFIGTTAGNKIIHEALEDAYNKSQEELRKDYNAFCRSLNSIVKGNGHDLSVKLLDEILFHNGTAEVVGENGRMLLLHFYGTKVIPKIGGTSWLPWNP